METHTMRRIANRERGYNLVEVLLAMALLGTVIVSIMALFFMGQRNVYSGKQMTQAAAIATHVLEDINGMNKSQMLAAFGLGTSGAGSSNTVYGQTFANSFIRTTTSISSTTDPKGLLASWNNEIVNNNKFQEGKVTLVMVPFADGTNNPAQMATADMLRCRVFVTWKEASRQRMVTVDALKIERQ